MFDYYCVDNWYLYYPLCINIMFNAHYRLYLVNMNDKSSAKLIKTSLVECGRVSVFAYLSVKKNCNPLPIKFN